MADHCLFLSIVELVSTMVVGLSFVVFGVMKIPIFSKASPAPAIALIAIGAVIYFGGFLVYWYIALEISSCP